MMETRPADDVTERIALAIDAPQLVCLRNPAVNGCATATLSTNHRQGSHSKSQYLGVTHLGPVFTG
jgi:hypothetical protein